MANLRCFIICNGLPKSITGMQANAINTKSFWKKLCPPNMYTSQPGGGVLGVLNSTMSINVIKIEGAQDAEYGALKRQKKVLDLKFLRRSF